MRPQPRRFIAGTASRVRWKAADRFTAIASSQAVGVERLDRRGVAHHGVVHQDVALRQLARRVPIQLLDPLPAAKVGVAEPGAHAVLALERAAQLCSRRRVGQAVQHDVAAGGRQLAGDGQAQPLRRAGDDRALPCEG